MLSSSITPAKDDSDVTNCDDLGCSICYLQKGYGGIMVPWGGRMDFSKPEHKRKLERIAEGLLELTSRSRGED